MSSFPRISTALVFALRELRKMPWELLLATVIAAVGSAGIAGVDLFKSSAQAGLAAQEKVLLGADLMVMSRVRPTPEMEESLRQVEGQSARVVSFMTMATFPTKGEDRFVQVRAVDGPFPFYGEIESVPPGAARELNEAALIDESLAAQFGVVPGDTILLGETSFRVAGAIRSVPGDYAGAALIAPRVIVPLAPLQSSALLGFGALARWITFFRLPEEVTPEEVGDRFKPRWEKLQLEYSTPKMRAASFGRGIERGSTFFSLGALTSLAMALTGVALAAQLYLKRRLPVMGILASIGFRRRDILLAYSIQLFVVAALGAALGIGGGSYLAAHSGSLLQEVLPAGVPLLWSGKRLFLAALLLVLLIGSVVIRSLLSIVRYRPSEIFRQEAEAASNALPRLPRTLRSARSAFGSLLPLACFMFFAAWLLSGKVGISAGFVLVLAISLGLIALFASGVASGLFRVSRFFPFPLRYATRNVIRGTGSLRIGLYSLSLSITAISLLLTLRASLLYTLSFNTEEEPNTILFDIQPDQRSSLGALLEREKVPPIDSVPLVTMRLHSLKGVPVRALLNQPDREIPGWTLRREYRSTYRAELAPTEELEAGTWWDRNTASAAQGVSVESGIASDLQLTVGDEISFDVQGKLIHSYVQSIRSVDWKHMRPNFFIVFPPNILESAPQTWAFAVRAHSPVHLSAVQAAVRAQFPNVSSVDLESIIRSVRAILEKISAAVRILVAVTLTAALFVMMLTVLGAAAERRDESALLRILGAPRAMRTRIRIAEASIMSSLAVLVGATLGLVLSMVACRFALELPLRLPNSELATLYGFAFLSTLLVATTASGRASR